MSDENKFFTPYELIHIVSLSSIQTFERDYLTIRGRYCEPKKNQKNYSGIFYDQIADEPTGKKLTAKIPETIRAELKIGYCYEFEGVLERQTFDHGELNIYLCFSVSAVKNQRSSLIASEVEERYFVLQNRNAKPHHNIDSLLSGIFYKNEKPRIALMSAENSETKPDVYNSIGDRINYYRPKDIPVILTNKSSIIRNLKETEEAKIYDLIVLYRGGGRMEVFEDVDIAKAILELKTPFIAALGHSNDRPLAELVSDRAFITPSALGTYLRDCAGNYLEINELKENLRNKEEWFQSQINTKEEAYAKLRNNLTQTLTLQKDSQNEVKQLKTQNENLKKEIAENNISESRDHILKKIEPPLEIIILIGLLLIVTGVAGGAIIILSYQYIFSENSPAVNSSTQRSSTNEASFDAINSSLNSGNASNKNQRTNRQK